ncbi:hypothetical protein CN202_01660 [Sinorhizobium meliloti]|uniref:hypothetical protein n=1 Tax=Rhizobium meliloti TaxID=382 RepID=UPI000FDB50E3|nr:hypothetical protein [Sinorhizobium meliloti]RVI36643.1 hypothetical protein CN202_01660 [Sinorhizobium meliloti]
MNTHILLLMVDTPFPLVSEPSNIGWLKGNCSMDILNKLLANPIINIVVSVAVGYLLARYAYKINYLNKRRYKKYLSRRISTISSTLFLRRDAYFARFIIRTSFVIMTSCSMLALWLTGFLLTLHKSSLPDPIYYQVGQWVVLGFSAAMVYQHTTILFRLVGEVEILLRPRPTVEKLRDEILQSDKRELLNDEEVKELTKSLDRLGEDLSHLKKMAVRPPYWATQVLDDEKPTPSGDATPAQ